ncbi:Ubiquitin-like protein 7 [Halotydeus destructor]|nr:Ubiquitin-like protein 7 [Halotydeus destructor]
MSVFVISKLETLQNEAEVEVNLPEPALSTSVKDLYDLVTTKLNLKESSFDLICFGKILSPDNTLAFYGIRSGAIVFAFERRVEDKGCDVHKQKLDPLEIKRMIIGFKTALVNPKFKDMFDKLKEREFRENVIECTPGLGNDPVALALLQDLELVSLYMEPDSINQVLEKHPSLVDAAIYLAAAFHEESITSPSGSSGPQASLLVPANPNYPLDISDDEEDEPEQGSSSGNRRDMESIAAMRNLIRGNPANRNQSTSRSLTAGSASSNFSSPIVTPQMLANALRSVNSPNSTQSASGTSSSVSSSAPRSEPSRPLQVAEAQPLQPSDQPVPSSSEATRDWSRELLQLQEMGITDEIMARNALEAAGGDIQLAVEIITGNS